MKKLAVFNSQRKANGRTINEFRGVFNNFDLEYFGYNISFAFENYTSLLSSLSDEDEEKVENWREKIDEGNIDESDIAEFNEIVKNYDLTFEDLGDVIVLIDGNHVDLTLKEYNSDKGSVSIDTIYDTWWWCEVDEVDEDDLSIILEENSANQYIYLRETYKYDFFEFLKSVGLDTSDIATILYYDYDIDTLLREGYIDTLDEEDDEGDGIEWDGILYKKD